MGGWDIEEMSCQMDSQSGMTKRARINSLKHIAAALFILVAAGCSVVRLRTARDAHYDPNQGTTAEDIAQHFPMHRGRWWNYFTRGCEYLAYEHYQEALYDFEMAINKKDADTRRAHTYGVDFVEYFPHRESGMAYCRIGEQETNEAMKEKLFEKAIQELKISLEQAPSSKADFYLKRATAGFWRSSKVDTKPPIVWIANNAIDRWEDPPTLYIKGNLATLRIQASDDQSGVGTVWLDCTKLLIESVEKTFERDMPVTVNAPENEKTVIVRAVDLAGNMSSPKTVKLIVDTNPPMIVIELLNRITLSGGAILVKFSAVDDRGLKYIQIGKDPNNRLNCRGALTYSYTIAHMGGGRELAITVVDRAGNTVSQNIPTEQDI